MCYWAWYHYCPFNYSHFHSTLSNGGGWCLQFQYSVPSTSHSGCPLLMGGVYVCVCDSKLGLGSSIVVQCTRRTQAVSCCVVSCAKLVTWPRPRPFKAKYVRSSLARDIVAIKWVLSLAQLVPLSTAINLYLPNLVSHWDIDCSLSVVSVTGP